MTSKPLRLTLFIEGYHIHIRWSNTSRPLTPIGNTGIQSSWSFTGNALSQGILLLANFFSVDKFIPVRKLAFGGSHLTALKLPEM